MVSDIGTPKQFGLLLRTNDQRLRKLMEEVNIAGGWAGLS